MTDAEVIEEGASVVLLGSFNPRIFQPAWLVQEGLIDQLPPEAEFVVSPDEATMPFLGDGQLHVNSERLQVMAPAARGPGVRLLAQGVLERLSHTPVRAIGINRHMHFRISSRDSWNRVGHVLADKAPWQGLIEHPGMKTVVIEGKRLGMAATGILSVTVEPSKRVDPGVFIQTNEHYPVESGKATDALDQLGEWNEAQRHARFLAEELLKRCLKA